MGSAVLISQMSPPPGEEQAFDTWYQTEHIPLRMRVPGFHSALRARAVQGEPAHLVIYYFASRDVLKSEAYQEVKNHPSTLTAQMLATVTAFTRYTGDEIGDTGAAPAGRYLYLVTFAVPAAHLSEFDAWYEQDHLPHLLRHPAWSRCRRYSIVESEPAGVTRAAVHELTDLAALTSPERERARATPWRAQLAQHPWFSSASYAVYERFQDFQSSSS
jgi:hypothetical protein